MNLRRKVEQTAGVDTLHELGVREFGHEVRPQNQSGGMKTKHQWHFCWLFHV